MMNVTVLYDASRPRLISFMRTYNIDDIIKTKIYYETFYASHTSMLDRAVYYMTYLASYRVLRDTGIPYDKLKLNPIFLTFFLDQFQYEINQYLLPYPDYVKFLTGLCVVATRELIALKDELECVNLFQEIFIVFNNTCMGCVSHVS